MATGSGNTRRSSSRLAAAAASSSANAEAVPSVPKKTKAKKAQPAKAVAGKKPKHERSSTDVVVAPRTPVRKKGKTKKQPRVGRTKSPGRHSSTEVASTVAATPVTPSRGSSSASTPCSTPVVVVAKTSRTTPTKLSVAAGSAVVSPNPQKVAATKKKSGGGSHPVDADIAVAGKVASHYEVVAQDSSSGDNNVLWFDAVLNQCNIGQNNNKYYRLQVLKEAGSGDSGPFYTWFKWGRVGEPARNTSSTWCGPYSTKNAAANVFGKKYRDKTGNTFGAPNFVTKSNKYVPIEVDNDVEVKDPALLAQPDEIKVTVEYMKSALDPKTKELVEVLFSKEMRSEALTSFNLDLRRLPLGVPSKAQIEHGIAILREIEDKLNGVPGADGVASAYQHLSSRFYTAIPHSFGRSVPPTIATKESLQSRYDMCNILLDMYETTETVKRIEAETKVSAKKMAPNPVDQFYASLKADLTLVKTNSPEDKIIRQYFDQTKHSHSSARILDVWSVNRQGEPERFAAYDAVDNRRLLWHGTNIAVVAPIITTGLRIMPHSGGRVGAGIYLANMQQKSAQYTSGYGSKFACMFLCEAPLGKSHLVHQDGPHASGLRSAPAGYDSVHAVGTMHPKSTVKFQIDGKDVTVPNSAAGSSGVQSSFTHDEFLVYNESQVRLRYVITVKL